MDTMEIVSIILSSISLIGVMITALAISFRLGELNQKVTNHDYEISYLKKEKVSKDSFSGVEKSLEEIKGQINSLMQKGK